MASATLRGILRPGFPDFESRDELVAAAHALREAGVSGIAFYNYGLLRLSNLGWIADAARRVRRVEACQSAFRLTVECPAKPDTVQRCSVRLRRTIESPAKAGHYDEQTSGVFGE